MSIAVTGATGHLGRLVISGLLRTQPAETIVAIARDASKAADLAATGVQVRVASYEDRVALERALDGADKLLLISSSELGNRVAQHQNVVDAAVAVGVPHLIYTSAPHATTSALVLAPDHKATEEAILASGLTSTILRNGWYTENYLGQLTTAEQTGTIVAAVGDGRVASASRADFAAAAVAVLTGQGHEGKVYELSGDYAWNYDELASAVGTVLGKPVSYRPVDTAELVNILTESGLDEGTAQFVATLDTNTRDGLLAETSGELSSLIGRPTTPLLEGLQAAA